MLAETWTVLHPLQIFRGFGGGGSFPLAMPLILINIYFFSWVHSVLNFTNWNQIWLYEYILEISIEISILNSRSRVVEYEQCVPRWNFFSPYAYEFYLNYFVSIRVLAYEYFSEHANKCTLYQLYCNVSYLECTRTLCLCTTVWICEVY